MSQVQNKEKSASGIKLATDITTTLPSEWKRREGSNKTKKRNHSKGEMAEMINMIREENAKYLLENEMEERKILRRNRRNKSIGNVQNDSN